MQIKSTKQNVFFGLAFCFCWVGGVECYEHSYVRHLTVRRVQIKATCHKTGFHLHSPFSIGVTPEAKTCSTTKSPTSEETGDLLFFHGSGSTSILVSGSHTGKLLGMSFTLAVARQHVREAWRQSSWGDGLACTKKKENLLSTYKFWRTQTKGYLQELLLRHLLTHNAVSKVALCFWKYGSRDV